MDLAVSPSRDDVGMTTLTISCDTCVMQGTPACGGCVVTFICDRDPDGAIVIDAAEERAVRMLGRSGLVPPLRHRPRAGCA